MEKIADKKNGITTEDAAAYLTGVEVFFVCLMTEFIVLKFLPFRVSNFIIYGIMAIIWYYTHYILRKILARKMIETEVRKIYKMLIKSQKRTYLILSILFFFVLFFIFFATGFLTIYNYNKRWS